MKRLRNSCRPASGATNREAAASFWQNPACTPAMPLTQLSFFSSSAAAGAAHATSTPVARRPRIPPCYRVSRSGRVLLDRRALPQDRHDLVVVELMEVRVPGADADQLGGGEGAHDVVDLGRQRGDRPGR